MPLVTSPSTMPAPSGEVQPMSCAKCKKLAKQACRGCKDAHGSGQTHYCDAICQKAHWVEHKKICKDFQLRTTLYRAGGTLQQIFYVYREKFFDTPIVKIEMKDGNLYIHDRKKSAAVISEWHCIVPFPPNLALNTQEKQAMLVYSACSDALISMSDIIPLFISDIASSIMEVTHRPKNSKREVIPINLEEKTSNMILQSNGTLFSGGKDGESNHAPHTVWKITLKRGGGTFALDLAGAQYGYYQPVTPWSEYMTSRVQIDATFQEHVLGNAAKGSLQFLDSWPLWIPRPIWFGAGTRLNYGATQALNAEFQCWEQRDNGATRKVLKMPKTSFDEHERKLVGRVTQALQKFKEDLERKAIKEFAGQHHQTGVELILIDI